MACTTCFVWPADLTTPAQKFLVQGLTGPENVIKILSFHQKLFNFLMWTDTQIHRQTHALPSICKQVKFFNALFDPSHFTMFASLTPFMKDNILKVDWVRPESWSKIPCGCTTRSEI